MPWDAMTLMWRHYNANSEATKKNIIIHLQKITQARVIAVVSSRVVNLFCLSSS